MRCVEEQEEEGEELVVGQLPELYFFSSPSPNPEKKNQSSQILVIWTPHLRREEERKRKKVSAAEQHPNFVWSSYTVLGFFSVGLLGFSRSHQSKKSVRATVAKLHNLRHGHPL